MIKLKLIIIIRQTSYKLNLIFPIWNLSVSYPNPPPTIPLKFERKNNANAEPMNPINIKRKNNANAEPMNPINIKWIKDRYSNNSGIAVEREFKPAESSLIRCCQIAPIEFQLKWPDLFSKIQILAKCYLQYQVFPF